MVAKHIPSPLYAPWGPGGDTPAPWIVEDTDERVIVRDAQGGLIAECTNGFDGDDGWVMSSACGPLSCLLAAAPELLSELQLADRIIHILLNLVPDKFAMAEQLANVHDGEGAVRAHERAAVIAKATGG